MSETPETTTPETPEDNLGDAGKRALEAERTARKEAERRATEAEEKLAKIEADGLRSSVAADKGLTDAQASRLQGTTKEELEADADALLAAFTPESPETRSRPRERLRSGSVPGVEPEDTAAKVADRILGQP